MGPAYTSHWIFPSDLDFSQSQHQRVTEDMLLLNCPFGALFFLSNIVEGVVKLYILVAVYLHRCLTRNTKRKVKQGECFHLCLGEGWLEKEDTRDWTRLALLQVKDLLLLSDVCLYESKLFLSFNLRHCLKVSWCFCTSTLVRWCFARMYLYYNGQHLVSPCPLIHFPLFVK